MGISRRIAQMTNAAFDVKAGSPFPAFHRMEQAGWLTSSWGQAETRAITSGPWQPEFSFLPAGLRSGCTGTSAPVPSSPPRNHRPRSGWPECPIWLGFLAFIAAWACPFGPIAIRRTAFSDSVAVAICALGLFVCLLVAQGAWRGVEPGRRVQARAPAVEQAPTSLCAIPFSRPPVDGLGNGYCLGLAYCVCRVRVIRSGVLDKTESGGAASSAGRSQRIPGLRGTRQSADSVCALTLKARIHSEYHVGPLCPGCRLLGE